MLSLSLSVCVCVRERDKEKGGVVGCHGLERWGLGVLGDFFYSLFWV